MSKHDKPLVYCSMCGVKINSERVDSHVEKIHPDAVGKAFGIPKDKIVSGGRTSHGKTRLKEKVIQAVKVKQDKPIQPPTKKAVKKIDALDRAISGGAFESNRRRH